jgi:hypothetical protein
MSLSNAMKNAVVGTAIAAGAVGANAADSAATATVYLVITGTSIQAVDPVYAAGSVFLGPIPGMTEERSDILSQNPGAYAYSSAGVIGSFLSTQEDSNFQNPNLNSGLSIGSIANSVLNSGDLGVSAQSNAKKGGETGGNILNITDGFSSFTGNYYLELAPNTEYTFYFNGLASAEVNCPATACFASASYSFNTVTFEGDEAYTSGVNVVSTDSNGNYFEYSDSGFINRATFTNSSLTERALFGFAYGATTQSTVLFSAPDVVDFDLSPGTLPPVTSVPELPTGPMALIGALGLAGLAARRGIGVVPALALAA